MKNRPKLVQTSKPAEGSAIKTEEDQKKSSQLLVLDYEKGSSHKKKRSQLSRAIESLSAQDLRMVKK